MEPAATRAPGPDQHAHRKDPAVLGFNQPEITPEHTPVNHRGPPEPVQEAFSSALFAVEEMGQRISNALITDEELFATLQSRAFKGEL